MLEPRRTHQDAGPGAGWGGRPHPSAGQAGSQTPARREPHTWGARPSRGGGGAHSEDSLATELLEESHLGIQKSNVSIMAQSEKSKSGCQRPLFSFLVKDEGKNHLKTGLHNV